MTWRITSGPDFEHTGTNVSFPVTDYSYYVWNCTETQLIGWNKIVWQCPRTYYLFINLLYSRWKFENLLDGQLALRITAYYLTAWNRLLVRTLLRYYMSSCLTEFFHLRRKLMNFLPHTRRLIKWTLQTKLIKNVKAMWKPLYLPSLGEVSLIRNNILTAIIINKPTSFQYAF